MKRVSFTREKNPLGSAVIRGGPWLSPTYADSTSADFIDGEDLDVRRAAVEALGPYNGSVVVADPTTGRILTMVNQKLALGSGFQPCSTIKVSVALAALREKVITPTQKVERDGPELCAGAFQQWLFRDARYAAWATNRKPLRARCSATAKRPGSTSPASSRAIIRRRRPRTAAWAC